MGSLTLPDSGSIYLDAPAFIYSLEHIEPYCSLLGSVWLASQANQFEIVSSELVLLETLVKPLREKDETLTVLFRSLLYSKEVRLIPATAALWETAAGLRASFGLKAPDALHAATALQEGCKSFMTNDVDFRKIPDLPVVLLKDFVKS
ncbi:MAG: type II toxin-antitoxin system VapC family toxin [Nitrospirae bacterium]|nr:type II toxin-antitoxin system VapC family toxin [Nitrospirota bacterium]MDA1304878.1 type II toxin-antitoxin system VapC family toxin [Nitrospirota bacterium]